MLSTEDIILLQDQETRDWHQSGASTAISSPQMGEKSEWLAAVGREHFANFELWHIEDEARTPGATDKEIAEVKRRIDRTNQRRNDLAEELDRILWNWLEPRELPCPDAPLNSESPGLMIDRLSILSLKIYHTREEAERKDAPAGHRERNLERLTILEEQRKDLSGSLNDLWRETVAGTRRFKIYRQLKMYNDPALNPAIYQSVVREKLG
jgi:Protein of unknown function (DUF4254)